MKALKKMDVNKIARAIETDAEHALPGLRESLAQAKAGDFLRFTHGTDRGPPSRSPPRKQAGND